MTQLHLDVCVSPLLFPLYKAEGKLVVVIDILRATSTIATALHHGANAVIPVTDINECLSYAAVDVLCACEREGKIADGFSHGNSPLEYTPDVIKNKTLVLTTTNGTKCIQMSRAQQAAEIITGAFVNLQAVCTYIQDAKQDVLLFCSGWKDQFSLEDTLFAGAVCDALEAHFTINTDSAYAAMHLYRSVKNDLYTAVTHSSHYKRLAAHGVEQDIRYCCSLNQIDIVPFLTSNNTLISKKSYG